MKRILLALALLALAAGHTLAQTPRALPVISASTSNPAVGTLPIGDGQSTTCTVTTSAGTLAVTVSVASVTPAGAVSDFTEWTSASGSVTAGTPYVFVLPYRFDRLRISVANGAAATINAWCTPWVSR